MSTRKIPAYAYLPLLALTLQVACGGGGGGSSTATPTSNVHVAFMPHDSSTDTSDVYLEAEVSGTSNKGLTWSVVEGGGGTVASSGVDLGRFYHPPMNQEGIFHVRATSVADPTRFAEAAIEVRHPILLQVSGGSFAPFAGTVQFAGTVSRSADTQVLWSILTPGGGSIDSNGLYTAPATAGRFQIQGASHANPSVFDVSSVYVYDPASTVSLSPSTVTVSPGGTAVFTFGLQPAHPEPFMSYWMTDAPTIESFGNTITVHAPTMPGTYTLHVQFFQSPSLEATATITVQ